MLKLLGFERVPPRPIFELVIFIFGDSTSLFERVLILILAEVNCLFICLKVCADTFKGFL